MNFLLVALFSQFLDCSQIKNNPDFYSCSNHRGETIITNKPLNVDKNMLVDISPSSNKDPALQCDKVSMQIKNMKKFRQLIEVAHDSYAIKLFRYPDEQKSYDAYVSALKKIDLHIKKYENNYEKCFN